MCSQVSPPTAAATVEFAEYSLETFAQRLGLDRADYMGASPGVQFGCRAEKVNFWCRVGDADNLVKVSCNRRFGYKQCLEIEPSDT